LGGTGGNGGMTLSCETLTDPPNDCGKSCTSDLECEGAFCSNGVCAAHCTGSEGCGANEDCNLRGRCVSMMSTGGTGGSGNTGGGNVCGELEVATDRVIPNIMMIVDRSGSMNYDFNDCQPNRSCSFVPPSRWDAVVDALVGPTGLVRELDSIARFGLTLYWKTGGDTSGDGSMCAETDGVAFSQALRATTDPIAGTFSANSPDGYTPTAEAIESVTALLGASPPPEGPTVYLLATDGQPNGCDEKEENEDRDNSIAAVSDAFDQGIETFVLGVSFDDSHLQDLADAGQRSSGARLWTADSVAELQTALAQIVEQNIPCTVKLTDGQIDTRQACDGRVTLNGEPLNCNDMTRGWQAVDGTTIELTGSACTEWRRGNADLEAVFPCYVVVQ
jgi:hypothetical protein